MSQLPDPPPADAHPPTDRNIEALAHLEQETRQRRSRSQRLSDAITNFIGSMTFVVIHVVAFLLWVVLNLNLIPGVTAFDPFPFGILTLIVSWEGVMLTTFVLITQNRIMSDADRQAKLNLQISMLTEAESTKMLQLLQSVVLHLGIGQNAIDEETKQLSERTELESIAHNIESKLPRQE
jgi:uncharacterized membrane protein